MQTQNNILGHIIQLKLNNKISKLKAFSLFQLFKDKHKDTTYGILLAELQTMLIPPENILKLTSEVKEHVLPHEKAYELMLKGNAECATWFKTVEPLEFDFKFLFKTIMIDEFNELYKEQIREIDDSDLTYLQKINSKNELFKGHIEMLKELDSLYDLAYNETEKYLNEQKKIIVRKNEFGNFIYPKNNLIIDKETKTVIGKQNENGTLDKLTDEDIELCKLYNLKWC